MGMRLLSVQNDSDVPPVVSVAGNSGESQADHGKGTPASCQSLATAGDFSSLVDISAVPAF